MSEQLVLDENMSFEEMLDQSFKNLHNGDRISGIVTAVSPSEIHVDLGVKYTGVLPYEDVANDIAEGKTYNVGDEIDVVVAKVSDREGVVTLSRKKFNLEKNWELIEKAYNDKTNLEGTIADAVKGGAIINYKTNRVFIPFSQLTSELKKASEEGTLKGKEVTFKIIDVDAQKHRAVGSVRESFLEARKAIRESFYENIEIGAKYRGTVKSFVSFGAFVDLGGVDGMIHITEISWAHIKHPSDVLKIGQEVDVYVKAYDPETHKISLGYKTEESNPWRIFEENYKVDDVVKATVVSFTPFGAFANIITGIDGLIHISQIANKQVSKPADELTIGQEVEAKIIEIDLDKKRVSLSIRALLPEVLEEAELEAEVEATAEEATEQTAE